MEETQNKIPQFIGILLLVWILGRIFKKGPSPTIAVPSTNFIERNAPGPQTFISMTNPTPSASKEETVGGTHNTFPIDASVKFENIQLFKTNDMGEIGIQMDNGYVEKLINNGQYYSKSAGDGKYFNVNLIVSGGATYQYLGSIF